MQHDPKLVELIEMLADAEPNELGGHTWNFTPEEIGLHVMENRDALLAALPTPPGEQPNRPDPIREAVLAERERAARIAEGRHAYWQMPHPDDAKDGEVCDDISACRDIAAAIRKEPTDDAEEPGR